MTHDALIDRAQGAMLGMAAGDALGSQYEFGPAHDDTFEPVFGIGIFGHDVGEWTDDTSMAIPLLQAIARGDSLLDVSTLGRIVQEWDDWARTSKDVGAQTHQVLRRINGTYTEEASRAAAEAQHAASGQSAGNGSLMRTAPVALAFLGDGQEAELIDAARRVAQLTHWEDSNVAACALWCLLIRDAVRTGSIDLDTQVATLQAHGIDAGELAVVAGHPRDYMSGNGWIVRAFQSALVAVQGSTDFRDAVSRAIRGGGDTDTVAAITGSLAGALYGAAAIPAEWLEGLHGWPNYRAADLATLAEAAIAS